MATAIVHTDSPTANVVRSWVHAQASRREQIAPALNLARQNLQNAIDIVNNITQDVLRVGNETRTIQSRAPVQRTSDAASRSSSEAQERDSLVENERMLKASNLVLATAMDIGSKWSPPLAQQVLGTLSLALRGSNVILEEYVFDGE